MLNILNDERVLSLIDRIASVQGTGQQVSDGNGSTRFETYYPSSTVFIAGYDEKGMPSLQIYRNEEDYEKSFEEDSKRFYDCIVVHPYGSIEYALLIETPNEQGKDWLAQGLDKDYKLLEGRFNSIEESQEQIKKIYQETVGYFILHKEGTNYYRIFESGNELELI